MSIEMIFEINKVKTMLESLSDKDVSDIEVI